MEVENLNPVLGTLVMNVLIDLGFLIIFVSFMIWLIKSASKKHQVKHDLLRHEIDQIQAENEKLAFENFKLEKVLLIQKIIEGFDQKKSPL
jgi:hypothetical protein